MCYQIIAECGFRNSGLPRFLGITIYFKKVIVPWIWPCLEDHKALETVESNLQ